MKHLLILFCVVCLTGSAWAQDSSTDDDRSALTRFIEENLSTAGRDVRIIGFKGALSSQASLDELTISDHDGVWFTMRDAVLDWDRRAMLSGRLVVRKLSAKEIILPRQPIPIPAGSSAAAGEFALPEFPVSIEIGEISVAIVSLGDDLFGESAEVSFSGTGQLISGQGNASLLIERIDGPVGKLGFQASYNNATTHLDISLSLEEGDDGIFANMLGLPGTPRLKFNAEGAGPVAEFIVDVSLETAGQTRLAGQVRIDELTDQTLPDAQKIFEFAADLSGDVTPLFATDYKSFFGSEVELKAAGRRFESGRLEIDELTISTNRLDLDGSLTVQKDGLPEAFSLTASISDPTGKLILLPLGGHETELRTASITSGFQAAESDDWHFNATVAELHRDALKIGSGQISGVGKILRTTTDAGAVVRQVLANIAFDILDLAHDDKAIAQTFGPELTGEIKLAWTDGNPVRISQLLVSAGNVTISSNGEISGLKSGYEVSGLAKVSASDLSRFAILTGQKLSGGAEFELTGTGSVLGGKFDLQLAGSGQDLGIGIENLDRLISGAAKLSMAATRDEDGTKLHHLKLDSPAMEIHASGHLGQSISSLEFAAKLDNLARIADGFSGPASAKGTAKQDSGIWSLLLNAQGPSGTAARLFGRIAEDGNVMGLGMTGRAPLAVLNGSSNTFSVQGMANFDLTMTGAPSINSLTGTVSAKNAEIVFPVFKTRLDSVNFNADLSAGNAAITANAKATEGGRISANGSVRLLDPYDSSIALKLSRVVIVDPLLFRTNVTGDLQITGPLLLLRRVSGELVLGRTEIQLGSSGIGGGGIIPKIIHKNEPADVRKSRSRAGLLETSTTGAGGTSSVELGILIRAPNQVFVRGRGLDAELQGNLNLTGTAADILPVGQFDLIRGRLDILGKRLDLVEGSVTLQDSFDPTIRLVAVTRTDEEIVQIITDGPADAPVVTFTSEPELPEEEVLARLLFGRSLSQISPLQAAQLAAAIATLAGEAGGVVNKIRLQFGLDDLDISTNREGATALTFGKYISDNAYTDFTIDTGGKSEINLKLDITETVTAKGRLGSDGDTGIGIFFERDY